MKKRSSYKFPVEQFPALRVVLLYIAGILCSQLFQTNLLVLILLSICLGVSYFIFEALSGKTVSIRLTRTSTFLYCLIIFTTGFTINSIDSKKNQSAIEMLLSDLESIQKRLVKNKKKTLDEDQLKILNDALNCINNNIDISSLLERHEKKQLDFSGLLSIKPKIYVCNVDENGLVKGNQYVDACLKKYGKNNVIIICAEIENQIMELDPKDRKYFMTETGIKKTGLDLLIKTGYKILKLKTFFTFNLEETKAWTIPKNWTAIKAAGIIHSDFEKGFIKAETISYDDFVFYKGYNGAKNSGKLRLEGKDYIVQDGDILLFRFNT